MSKPVDKSTARWYTFLKEAKRYFGKQRPGHYDRTQHNRAFRRWAKKVSEETGGPLDD